MTIFQFLTFYINENVPKRRTKFAKVSSKLCQILNIRSKELSKTFKILPKWRNFAKSGHTDYSYSAFATFCNNNSLPLTSLVCLKLIKLNKWQFVEWTFQAFVKMGQPRPLFHLSSSFQTHIIICTTNKCEKCPSSIWCQESNSQPLELLPLPLDQGFCHKFLLLLLLLLG